MSVGVYSMGHLVQVNSYLVQFLDPRDLFLRQRLHHLALQSCRQAIFRNRQTGLLAFACMIRYSTAISSYPVCIYTRLRAVCLFSHSLIFVTLGSQSNSGLSGIQPRSPLKSPFLPKSYSCLYGNCTPRNTVCKEFRITAHGSFSVYLYDLPFCLHVHGACCIEGAVISEIKDIRNWSQFVSLPADYRRLRSDVIYMEKLQFLDRFYLVRFAVLSTLAYVHSLDIED